MAQKIQPIDDWQPLDDWQEIDDWEDATPNKGFLQKWDELWINQPLSQHLKWNDTQLFDPQYAANYYDDPAKRTEDQWKIPSWVPGVGGGTYRSLGAGLLEGSGNVLAGLTSPINLITGGTAGVATRAAKTARTLPGLTEAAYTTAPKVAATARRATQGLSAPYAVSGAARAERGLAGGEDREGPIDWADVAFGAAEMGGAGAGAMFPKNFPNAQPRLQQIADARTSPMVDLPLNQPPTGPSGQPLPTRVTLKQPTPAVVADLRNKGYVSGGVDENGYPVMIRKDVLDKIEAPPMPRPEPESSSIFGDNEIVFDEEITIKNPSAAAIKKLQDQGFELAEVDGNIAIFRPFGEQEMRVPAEGSGGSLVERMKRSEELLKQRPNRNMFQLSDEIAQQPEPVQPDFTQLMQEPGRSEFSPDMMAIDEPVAGGYSPKFVPRRGALENIGNAQEMRVPNVNEGVGGLSNVAMGGASPRVLDVLGSSLYSRDRPTVIAKELLQNAFDEHRIAGVQEPVRVLVRHQVKNPITGEDAKAMTIRDRGRGLPPDQIYTVLTDVGETGKAGIEGASGGFGFAKAAPFLGGKYARVVSVIDMPDGQRMRYTFEGNPAELKNQARGVALNEEAVGPNVPTGLEVTTFFDKEGTSFYDATRFVKNMTERSPSITSDVLMHEDYGGYKANHEDIIRGWLDENPNQLPEDAYTVTADRFAREEVPPLQDTIDTPGAKVNIHYAEPERGYQANQSPIHMLNKGLYQASDSAYYGNEPVPNVPRSIVADIIATVEEGHADYPFTANREQLNTKVNQAISNWVDENITSGARKNRVKELQRKYDSITAIDVETPVSGPRQIHILDDGNRLAPEEIQMIQESQSFNSVLTTLDDVNKAILSVADTLGWSLTPSGRLKKFGLLIQAPDQRGTTLGIHIPRPDDLNDSAILINLFEHLKRVMGLPEPLDGLSTGLLTTITHEQAHIPGGGHDTGFAYRHAQLMEALGRRKTSELLDTLAEVFDDGAGGINPELSEFLSIYDESRFRTASGDDAILATGVHSRRPTNRTRGEEGNAQRANTGGDEPSTLREFYELPRGLTTTADLSFGFRQGLPLITTKQWWTSWGEAVKALGSEGAYREVMAKIEADPIMQRRVDLNTGKVKKSFAQEAGLAITDLNKKLNNREESQRSTLAERLPLGVGKVVRASNRAYNAYLNQLRFETFKSLLDDARAMSVEGAGEGSIQHPGVSGWFGNRMQTDAAKAAELNPYRNMVLAKQIADFVNTGTGRGPLRMDLPTIEKGRLAMKERSLEQAGDVLTNVLFSPKLFASRVRMLNPGTYIMADPFVRKQYVKALLATAGAWGSIASIAALAGADVSLDPNSSDFGKIKIGNTRLDPAGGFQQFLVAASRLMSGEYTSSSTQQESELGQGFRAETRKDVAERFMVNKLHPVMRFAYDLMFASKYQPVHVGDRIAQMFIPLIVQDVIELAKEDPTLLPLVGLVGAGMGTQTYSQGEVEGKLVPPDMDMIWSGGTPRRAWDALIGNESDF